MVVRFAGRRWGVEAVEFWSNDEKLQLRAIDGAGRVSTRVEWAKNVEFEAGEVDRPAPPPAPVASDEVKEESGWLVEHPHDPRYGRESWYSGAHGFTIDSLQAIRFARKEDALREICRLPTMLAAELVATEHRWIGGRR